MSIELLNMKTFKTQFSVKRSEALRVCREWIGTGYRLVLVDVVLDYCQPSPRPEDILIFNAFLKRD
jgi:hypothetical protein